MKGVRIWGTQEQEPQVGAPIMAGKKDEVLDLIQVRGDRGVEEAGRS